MSPGIPNGRGRRQKGAVAEREVAAIFRAAGFTCDRTPNSGGLHIPGDLTGIDGFHIEVKRQETIRLFDWWPQAVREAPAGDAPIVAFRASGEKWRAVSELDVLAALMRRAVAAERDLAQARQALRGWYSIQLLAPVSRALDKASPNEVCDLRIFTREALVERGTEQDLGDDPRSSVVEVGDCG